jgi:GMP reductase
MASRKEVYMDRTYTFMHSKKEWTGVPIMSANMDTVGTPDMHKELIKHNMICCPAKHYLKINDVMDFRGPNICMLGGIDDIGSLTVHQQKYEMIGLDVANGYTIKFVDAVKDLRNRNPDKTIVAGNVVTADMTQELILAGADIVKVGIGPGSVCTTRIKTGVGYPQLSAVMECADAAHGWVVILLQMVAVLVLEIL